MLLFLLACRDPGLSVRARLASAETARQVPVSSFLWHAERDSCEGSWLDEPFLAVLDVAGDQAWFGGKSLGSLHDFAERNREVLWRGQRLDDAVGTTLSTLRDGHRAWERRCGIETNPQVLLAADPATPMGLLAPMVYAVGANAVMVADSAPDDAPDPVPADTEQFVTVLLEGGTVSVSLASTGATLATGSKLPDLSGLAPPRVGCALVASLSGDFGDIIETWDDARAQGVRRVRISLPLEEQGSWSTSSTAATLPPGAPTRLDPTGTVTVLPLYSPPPWVYDGADRCGTNPSFKVPNIACECM